MCAIEKTTLKCEECTLLYNVCVCVYLLHVNGPDFPVYENGPDGVGENRTHDVQVLTPHPPSAVVLPCTSGKEGQWRKIQEI